MNSVKIFDIPFTTFKKKDLIEEILKRVNKNEKTYIVTANAEIAMYAKQNKGYENIIKKANYIVPDGIGVVKGAKIIKSIYSRENTWNRIDGRFIRESK